jgi:adhesin/invasin
MSIFSSHDATRSTSASGRHHSTHSLLRALALWCIVAFGTADIALAAPVAVPNGDFSAPANVGSVGGGLLNGNATNVPIGSGPWTGSYTGVAGLLAPPTLAISAPNQNATIGGLLGISVLGLLNNGGYIGQVLTTQVQPNTRYILSADIDAGRVLQLGLLNGTHTGIQLAANNVVLASSDTAAPGAITLQPLQNTTYHLSMTYVSPVAITADPIELRLFAQPQGLLTADLLPTIAFDNIALDAVTLGVPATVGNIAGDGQSATVGTQFPIPLGLRVLDGAGNGVQGTQVVFNAPNSGASAVFSSNGSSGSTLAVLTDANGDASATTTANLVAGGYAVSVQVAGLAGPQIFHLTNAAGPPTIVQIPTDGSGGGDQSTTVDTAFADPLVVEVTDAFGNPVADTDVSYAVVAAPSGAGATLSSADATTDADGRASITATANSIAGAYVATAHVTGVASTATFDLANLAGAPAGISSAGGNVQSAAVTTSFALPLAVSVVDANNNPVAGVSVNFSAAAAGNGASATLSSATAVTGVDGAASVGATANSFAGSYAVTASVAGVGATAAFQLTNLAGSPASIVASGGGAQSTQVGTPFAQPLVVQALDTFGNTVPNIAVSFAVTAGPGGAAATLSASSAMTGSDGRASVGATANTVAGSYSATASVTGATAANFALTNTAGPPASIVLGSGGSGTQSTTVNTPFAQALTVRVNDSHGNAVANASVAFTVPASGASAALSSNTVATGVNGEASVQATANTVAGSYVASAAVDGVAGTLGFNLTNTAGTPHDVVPIGGDGSVGGGTQQSAQVNTPFPQPLKIRVRDQFQNPVAGVVATFVAPTGGATAMLSSGGQSGSTLSVTSDAGGDAVVLATANGRVGAYTVSAQAVGVATTIAYQLTNTPGNSATPIGGASQNTIVGSAFECALIVRLADPQGQPRAGIAVEFTAPPSGASALLSNGGTAGSTNVTVTTDLDGVAYVDATANEVPGPYAVTATESGVANAQVASFNLVNLDAGDPIFQNGFDLQCGSSPP